MVQVADTLPNAGAMRRNVEVYPWLKLFQNLIFFQGMWFLYFQGRLSGGEALLLYAVYETAIALFEVVSGYLSDRFGRRLMLIAAAMAGFLGAFLIAGGGSFAVFALAQGLLGISVAFAGGSDSALLHESLSADGREDELEMHELRAWRFTFSALAISAVTGGAMAVYSGATAFALTALAFLAMAGAAMLLAEPPRNRTAGGVPQLQHLYAAMSNPVLVWLFVMAILIHTFGLLPLVFGQPYILEALREAGTGWQAPLVSGLVIAAMTGLGIATSKVAPMLRERLGLASVVMLAFGLQVLVVAVLSISNGMALIVLLALPLVPIVVADPFITARMQPLLPDESRATLLGLRMMCARLVFAFTLFLAAGAAGEGELSYDRIAAILFAFTVWGLICLSFLGWVQMRLPIEED